MRWTYVIGPDWSDVKGLAILIRFTANMSNTSRDEEFREYIQRALEKGHSGVTITVEEAK